MNNNLKLKDLALPIFVETFLVKGMGMANIYLLSSYNEEAVAAVGVANQLTNFINMLFIFVTLGTAVIVSQNIGAGNKARAESASSVAVLLNLCIGICFGLTVFFFHKPILTLMGLTGQVMEYTSTYFLIVGGFCVINGLNFTLATIMRNFGKARPPMLVFLGINILNLIGNTIIIMRPFGFPDFGIGGIAMWTVFSQSVGFIAMFLIATKNNVHLHIKASLNLPIAKEILKIGTLGSGDNFAYSIANIAMTYYLTALGTVALTSFAYATNLIAFVQLLGYSVGQGTQILVGRLVGALKFDKAYKRAYRSTFFAIALNVSAMILLFVFQRPILSLFTSNSEIMQIVFWCFVIDMVLEIGRPFNLVIGLSVRGAGDVKWAIVASVSSIFFVLIPFGYLFTAIIPLGVPGVFIALCADEWLRGQLMHMRWRSRKWEKTVLSNTV